MPIQQTALDTSAYNDHAFLMTCSYGPISILYCNRDQPIVIGSEVFQAAPSLQLEFGKFHGGTNADEVDIKIRRDDEHPPFDALSEGYAHADVRVKIEECDPSDPANTRKELFFGRIGGKGKVKKKVSSFKALGVKAALSQSILGVPALTLCPWRLGDENTCKVDMSDKKKEVFIDEGNVDGKPYRVRLRMLEREDAVFLGYSEDGVLSYGCGLLSADTTTDSSGNMTGIVDAAWRQGYIEDQYGLRIRIRQALGDDRFDLGRFPPPSWLCGQSLTMVQGCDGLLSTCRDIYDNEFNFGAFGYAIPSRNVLFEEKG